MLHVGLIILLGESLPTDASLLRRGFCFCFSRTLVGALATEFLDAFSAILLGQVFSVHSITVLRGDFFALDVGNLGFVAFGVDRRWDGQSSG